MTQMGLKSRVFIYYLQNVKGSQATNKFSIDYIDEAEKEKYTSAAFAKLSAKYGEGFLSRHGWAVKSEASIMLDNDAFEARQWLIDNGYLFQNTSKKHNGQMTVYWTGVTKKGWEVAPKYLALVEEREEYSDRMIAFETNCCAR